MTPRVLALLVLTCAAPAWGDGGDDVVHRWEVGLEVDPVALPSGHLGIPLGADESAVHLGAALTFRGEIDGGSAVVVGLGLPSSALGAGAWVDYERFVRLVGDPRGPASLALYTEPGVQLGFAGPDSYARHDNVFVGYGYAFGGAPAFALRFPTGLRVSFARSRFDVYAAAVPQVLLTPSVEVLFVVSTGVRVRF